MGVKLVSASAGSVELVAPVTASNYTATMPAKTGTVMIDGPAFSYWQSVGQSIANNTWTKLTFTSSEFDTTSGMYASSRFTPTVAGYYQINSGFNPSLTSTDIGLSLYKNGLRYKDAQFQRTGSGGGSASGSALVYLNGSTDYVEAYGFQGSGATITTTPLQVATFFQGSMVRGA